MLLHNVLITGNGLSRWSGSDRREEEMKAFEKTNRGGEVITQGYPPIISQLRASFHEGTGLWPLHSLIGPFRVWSPSLGQEKGNKSHTTCFNKKCALTFLPSLAWDKAWALRGGLGLALLRPTGISPPDCCPEWPLLIGWHSQHLPYGI